MKRPFLLSSKTRMAFMIACSSIMLFASCSKKNDIQPIPVGELDFKAVNTVSGSLAQDIVINGAVKVTALAYGNASAYVKMISGTSNLAFFDTGTTAQANVGGNISDLPIGAKISAYYYKKPLGGFSASFYNDATTTPTTGKAKVRFINLDNAIATTTPITVSADGAAGTLVPSILFLEDSAFFEVAPGTKFSFAASGVTGATAFDGTLVADKIYTIWIDGTLTTNPATHTLTGHVVVNN